MLNKKSGFSMLELVVVMLIMGTLAGIAISKMGGSDIGAIKAGMKSDMKNAITTINACYADELNYTKCVSNVINLVRGENSLSNANYKITITTGNIGSITNFRGAKTFPTLVIKNNSLPRGRNTLVYNNSSSQIGDFQ